MIKKFAALIVLFLIVFCVFAKPTKKEANDFINFFFYGIEESVVLTKAVICKEVIDKNCVEPVTNGRLEINQRYFIWMSFVVPQNIQEQNISIQLNQDGKTKRTLHTTIMPSFRYRSWKLFRLKSAGAWNISIQHQLQDSAILLETLKLTVPTQAAPPNPIAKKSTPKSNVKKILTPDSARKNEAAKMGDSAVIKAPVESKPVPKKALSPVPEKKNAAVRRNDSAVINTQVKTEQMEKKEVTSAVQKVQPVVTPSSVKKTAKTAPQGQAKPAANQSIGNPDPLKKKEPVKTIKNEIKKAPAAGQSTGNPDSLNKKEPDKTIKKEVKKTPAPAQKSINKEIKSDIQKSTEKPETKARIPDNSSPAKAKTDNKTGM